MTATDETPDLEPWPMSPELVDKLHRFWVGRDFVLSDRHAKFYPDLPIYIPYGLGEFLRLVEEELSAKDIAIYMRMPYRGDVLFAQVCMHFIRLDRLKKHGKELLTVTKCPMPPELADRYEEFRAAWARRDDPKFWEELYTRVRPPDDQSPPDVTPTRITIVGGG